MFNRKIMVGTEGADVIKQGQGTITDVGVTEVVTDIRLTLPTDGQGEVLLSAPF
jgi:hypothetical protein